MSVLNTNTRGIRAGLVTMDSTKDNISPTEIMEALQISEAQLAILQKQNVVLQAHATPPSAPNPIGCEPKFPIPDKFSGNHKFCGFLNRHRLLFLL